MLITRALYKMRIARQVKSLLHQNPVMLVTVQSNITGKSKRDSVASHVEVVSFLVHLWSLRCLIFATWCSKVCFVRCNNFLKIFRRTYFTFKQYIIAKYCQNLKILIMESAAKRLEEFLALFLGITLIQSGYSTATENCYKYRKALQNVANFYKLCRMLHDITKCQSLSNILQNIANSSKNYKTLQKFRY